MTVNEILSKDVNNYTKDELENALKILGRQVLRRESYIRNNYENTPAIIGIKKALETKMSILQNNDKVILPKEKTLKDMSLNDMRKLFSIEKTFLITKTSRKEGADEWIKNLITTVYKEDNVRKINKLFRKYKKKMSEIWELIDKIREIDPGLMFRLGSGDMIEQVMESYDEIREPVTMKQKLEKIYHEKLLESSSLSFQF